MNACPDRVARAVRKRRRSRASVPFLLAFLALLALPAAAAAVEGDYGDAPDGRKTSYAGGAGSGQFPSLAATPGPVHTPVGAFYLGSEVDAEADSEQVNRDEADDGASARLSKCGESTLELALNAVALPAGTRTAAHTAYVNAWFDWNRDGDWADPDDGCAPEWAIQNLPVEMTALSADGIASLPVGFTAGKRNRDLWYRVTLTLDEPVVDPTGEGGVAPYAEGETEDYLIPSGKRAPAFDGDGGGGGGGGGGKGKGKGFKVSCVPNPALILHGGTAKVDFAIADKGKGLIFGTILDKGKGGRLKLRPRKPQPKGVPRGWVVVDGFSFKSTKVDPPTRIEKATVKFFFRRGKHTQKLDCAIVIVHLKLQMPRIVCGGACAGGSGQALPPTADLGAGWRRQTVPIGTVPTEIVQLQLHSMSPVPFSGFDLPLHAQSPPWTTAQLLQGSDPQMQCTRATFYPEGGPAALRCRRPPGPPQIVNSLFEIWPGVTMAPNAALVAAVVINNQRYALTAPEIP